MRYYPLNLKTLNDFVKYSEFITQNNPDGYILCGSRILEKDDIIGLLEYGLEESVHVVLVVFD